MKDNARKLIKTDIVGLILFALAILAKGIGDAIFIHNNPNSTFNYVKYIFLLLFIFYFIIKGKGKSETIFRKEYRSLLLCYIGIGIIS